MSKSEVTYEEKCRISQHRYKENQKLHYDYFKQFFMQFQHFFEKLTQKTVDKHEKI